MASATKLPAPPPWGPALLRLRDGDKLDDFELDALPGLAWAGWAERRSGGYAITERGQDALNHLRRRRRWPSEEELNRALLDAPSLPGPAQRACQHETTAPPHEQPRNISLIARLVEEYGFRVEEVPGDPGSRRVIPPRGEGYGVLDFDKTGQLACCAWELSTQRKDRHRIMDLAAGVSEAQLVTWLRWGRERARNISACTPRRHEELLRGAGLRLGCLLGQGYDTIHPAESGSPAVGRVVVNIGLIVELTWLEPWGSSHSRTYPDGATEADVSAWLEPWVERRQGARETTLTEAPSPLLAPSPVCTYKHLCGLVSAAGAFVGLGSGGVRPIEVAARPVPITLGRAKFWGGRVVELRWLEPWGEGHNCTYPDGATEADVSAWLEPWIERAAALQAAKRRQPSAVETGGAS